MDGIVWMDVRATLPQFTQAHNGTHGDRSAETRLWFQTGHGQPFRLKITLLVGGAPVEIWRRAYSGYSVSHAHRAYENGRVRAHRWLNGFPAPSLRPAGWQIERVGQGAP